MNPQERAFCGDMAASIGFIHLMDVPTGRVKVGFSENPYFRVKNLRSIVPDLAIVDKWPALKIWESTARHYYGAGFNDGPADKVWGRYRSQRSVRARQYRH